MILIVFETLQSPYMETLVGYTDKEGLMLSNPTRPCREIKIKGGIYERKSNRDPD
jgi:hypothetical protein